MFVGSINSKIRNLIFNEKKIFRGQKVCVGCSGNFTVEQILQGLDCEIWSNDVALYSSLIGNYLAGNPMRGEITDSAYSWLQPYMEDKGIGRIAAVSLLFEMLKQDKGNNLQQVRMFEHYRNNFENYHQQSIVKIAEILEKIKIRSYTSWDVYQLYEDLPTDWVRIAFLPTYVGGYEKLYSRLEKIIYWDAPSYDILTPERYEETVAFMRRGKYLYLSDYDRKEDGLFGIVKTGRLKNVYLYSNIEFKKSFIMPYAKHKKSNYSLLPDDHAITEDSKIIFQKSSNEQLNYYKNLFLKKGIDYSTGMSPMMVFLDGYLFGFLLFDVIRYGMDQEKATRGVYLLPDEEIINAIREEFFAALTDFPRYEKLTWDDVDCSCGDYDEKKVIFDANDSNTATAEQFELMEKIKTLIPAAEITLREHTAYCDRCNEDDDVDDDGEIKLYSLKVGVTVGEFYFTREYAV